MNKRIPVDPPARADGRVVRVVRADGKIRLHVLTGPEMPWQGPVTETEGPFMPHHATCPNAEMYRPAPRGRRPRRIATTLICRVCHGVMNARVTAAEGTSTHPGCDPTDGVPAATLAALGYGVREPAPAATQETLAIPGVGG
jgi:hypothetical protein